MKASWPLLAGVQKDIIKHFFNELAVAHGFGKMHGRSRRALDVVVVCQVRALLFYSENISHHYGETIQATLAIAKGRRCATICMGGGGSVWAKPPSPQP
eukprot:5789151-Amphidinium_carterae.1